MSSPIKRSQARSIVLATVLFVVGGWGLYTLGPWTLPVRIIEGPMLQQGSATDGETGVSLIWYTTRALAPGDCQVTIAIGGQEHTLTSEASGKRNRVRIDGLAPGLAYPYTIRLAGRRLAESVLHTNKPAGTPFSFIVFGDSGLGGREQYRLAGKMVESVPLPDFMLHTGDLVYSRGARNRYKDRFFAPYRKLLSQVNFWPCLGNHDISKPDFGQPYLDVFELPQNGPSGVPAERNYWFDYASARVAVIDSNLDEVTLKERVAPWLREVMTGSRATWKFISLHHPPYTAGGHHPNLSVQHTLVPIFDEVGVDIVFCGHDHIYERTYPMRGGQRTPEGVVYVVTGGGGGQLYDARPAAERPAYLPVVIDHHYSFTHVQIDGQSLQLRQLGIDGKVLDEWATVSHSSAPASGRAAATTSAPTLNSPSASQPVGVTP
jgi:acid phosphatase type 7